MVSMIHDDSSIMEVIWLAKVEEVKITFNGQVSMIKVSHPDGRIWERDSLY